jgi:hypothetical protein
VAQRHRGEVEAAFGGHDENPAASDTESAEMQRAQRNPMKYFAVLCVLRVFAISALKAVSFLT